MAIKKSLIKQIVAIFVLLTSISITLAAPKQPLQPDQAFQFSIRMQDAQTIAAEWQMAPGYYLYADKFKFESEDPTIKLGEPLLPTGITKSDPLLGDHEIYKDKVSIAIPILSLGGEIKKLNLEVKYQGCSEEGYCYPPAHKKVELSLNAQDTHPNNVSEAADSMAATTTPQPTSTLQSATQLLSDGHLFPMIFGFLGFGLLLSFTPCVLPMIPILSSIIVGHQYRLTTRKAFSLSFVYVLSMSLTYAIAGILIGYIGGSIQTAFQKPWLLVIFSGIFVLLALSFFGLYELQLPQRLQTKLTSLSNRQKGGTYIGVAIMGALATLIVSPCVTPALVGALGYIGQTGNALIGGIALFALGFGMGLPLLLIGTAGGKLLPRAGIWMNNIKYVFGIILLAMAIWILDRILPGPITMMLWAALLIITAIFMEVFGFKATTSWSKVGNGLAVIMLVYGVLLIVGAAMGNGNPLQPLNLVQNQTIAPFYDQTRPTTAFEEFRPVKSLQDVEQALEDAKSRGKYVLLDFSAKWCMACKIMDHQTFQNPQVMTALSNFIRLQADVTANDTLDKELLRYFNVIAPPTLLFFDPNGNELSQYRIIGEMKPTEFLKHLQAMN